MKLGGGFSMIFPITRHRRLRQSSGMRNMVRETVLTVNDFIQPIFITHGEGIKNEISSMPGIYHFSIDRLEEELKEIVELGISAVLLFGIPESKDEVGSSAFAEDGIVQQATRKIKSLYPDLLVVADTCLCEFTDHGHCGMVHTYERDGHLCGDVMNDESLDLLVKTAVSQAAAGADIIAPSNMMDGFVQAIRTGLDEAGYTHIPIMSYSVKYASAFYGPFREAADSAPQFGDRKTYQMDPANVREALREAESDVAEGADMLMVKPALAFMDVISLLRQQFDLPLVAYNVSGEYSMVKAAALQGWINEKAIVTEMLLGMKRAGADIIITYFAKDMARWLREN
jgi:porphobilinogen synthase